MARKPASSSLADSTGAPVGASSQQTAAPGQPPAADPSPSFEESLQEVEAVVRALERGELTLGESLSSYERGVMHLRNCYAQLEQAERRVELVRALDAAGQIDSVPFDEGEMSLEEKAAKRDQRRTAAGSAGQRRQNGTGTGSGGLDGVDGDAGLF